MFMFHHHLRQGHAPADALWLAQHWMVSGRREAPDSMPAELKDHADSRDLAAWAGFIHLGQ